MPVTAVVGAQWGDEGKGRMVDYLAQDADLVIRFQGGDNAGHTVVNAHGKFALHLIPSGIFNPFTVCIIGTGAVVNPATLLEEMGALEAAGVPLENLWLSNRAHVVLPYHRMVDGLQEAARSGARIGTTGRGIGPTYSDKAARFGVRLGDLKRPDYLRQRIALHLEQKNRTLALFGAPPLDLDDVMETCLGYARALGDRIVDTLPLVQPAVRAGKRVLLEGQLGVMRDLDWGTYPYVTSSNPIVGAASAGAGLPPSAIDRVVGVVKAYSTAVGAGPFPSELDDADGERLRLVGAEYGATTGRPRRCGWYDAVAVGHAAWLNGFTSLAVTKLDVLDGMRQLKVCTGYRLADRVIDYVPDTPDMAEVTPIYETWPGWDEPTTEARDWDDLPKAARTYLHRISELAGVPIEFVSVGAERDQLLKLELPA
ncbi:MAG: adenylosuccinate synthase [Deltaproteobacteria bacterium HGW-Deltaproteobacteria-14]|jgi:adenylosuccinate synthase|nr:MAG: adenylosuccinate synthase [Deltaproteobacteria bacterium HGW-Deltaproteobacteria-14]